VTITPLGQLILDLLEHVESWERTSCEQCSNEVLEILHRFDPDLKNQEHVDSLKVKKRDETN
jgi:hypothetical protein